MNKRTMQFTPLKNNRIPALAAGIGLSGLLAAAIGGCGGTKTSGTSLLPAIPSTSVAYGLNATIYAKGLGSQEASGLESADESTLYLTAATASTSIPISNDVFPNTTTIPLGFANGALFENSAVGTAVAPGASVKFRVTISNGVSASGATLAITNVVMTSPELATQTLTFNPNYGATFGLATATYVTQAFTLPSTLASGLHSLTIAVTDSSGTTTTTTYEYVVLNPGDAAVLVQTTPESFSTSGVATPGGQVSIQNPIAGTVNPAFGDEQGEAVLFSKPGSNITVTAQGGSSENVNLTAGKITIADSTVLQPSASPSPTPTPQPD